LHFGENAVNLHQNSKWPTCVKRKTCPKSPSFQKPHLQCTVCGANHQVEYIVFKQPICDIAIFQIQPSAQHAHFELFTSCEAGTSWKSVDDENADTFHAIDGKKTLQRCTNVLFAYTACFVHMLCDSS